jgi:phosphoglycerate dehydrogenase-like enzyme
MKIKLLAEMTEAGIRYIEDSKTMEFTNVDKNAEAIYLHFDLDKFDPKYYPRLRYILCPCTNVNHIPKISNVEIIYLDDKQFLYDNVWSTAEHTVYLMLSLMKRTNRQLKDSLIGYIGFGRVAKQVMELLKGFRMATIGYDKNSTKEHLYGMFKRCDIITVHLKENEETKDLINKECFNICEKKPIFINTSRSSIVVVKDLIHAYRSKQIAGIGLDVTESYTPKEVSELKSLRCSLITPHMAGKSEPSRIATDRYVLMGLEELRGLNMND